LVQNNDLVGTMEVALDEMLRSGAPVDEARSRSVVLAQESWMELRDGAARAPPAEFRARFFGPTGWAAAFRALVQDTLKKRPLVRDAFILSRLAALRDDSAALRPALDALAGETRAMRAVLERTAEDAASARRNTEEILRRDVVRDDKLDELLALVRAQVVPRAAAVGLAERTVLALARRLRPEETQDLGAALRDVEHAVEIAVHTIRRGERIGSNKDAFADRVLAEVGRRTAEGAFDLAVQAVDDGLAELAAREAEQRDVMRRARADLMEAGIAQEIMWRDAEAVAHRVKALVALDAPEGRAPWAPAFRVRWDNFHEEGRDKRLNFSLEVAIALARRMLATAVTAEERGDARGLLGLALLVLGEREAAPGRLHEALLNFFICAVRRHHFSFRNAISTACSRICTCSFVAS
jgi:hypothetical protein